jgi:hypothetical protein
MRRVGELRHRWLVAVALAIWSALASGCVSLSDGPPRLYTIPEETQLIRDNVQQINLVQYASLDEPSRKKIRNDWLGARMYAIDIQYTAYEAALTQERQGVGFGAAATTLALTTASGLIGPVATKNLLTGLAGFVTGTRAAYDNDVLLAHSVQWIQSQMRTQRSIVAERILRGMQLSTTDYPLAAAYTDLEDLYRAGTFTGGMLSTSATLGAEAQLAELVKQDRIEVAYVSTAAGKALGLCVARPHPGFTQAQQKARLVALMPQPSSVGFGLLVIGQSPLVAEAVLQKATLAGICP